MNRALKTHPQALLVRPIGEGITSEMCTEVKLDDEGAGPFVVVEQTGAPEIGKVTINPEEWPAIRAAVDHMIALCAEIEAEEVNT
jgi:hypothetical protein